MAENNNLFSGIGSGAIGAGLSIVGGLLSARSARKEQKRQYEYNRQLQQQAADLQNQSWNMQRDRLEAYDDPAAQRARLQAAGMNPNLTYGNQWTAGDNISASAPNASVEQSQAPGAYNQMAAQLSQIASNIEVNKSIVTKNEADANLSNTKAEAEKNEDVRRQDLHGVNKEILERQVELLTSQKNLTDKEKDELDRRFELDEKEVNKRIDKMAEEIVTMKHGRDLDDKRFELEKKKVEADIKQGWRALAIAQQEADQNGAKIAQDIKESKSRVAINHENYKSLHEDNILDYDPRFGYTIHVDKESMKLLNGSLPRGNKHWLYTSDGHGGMNIKISNAYFMQLSEREVEEINSELRKIHLGNERYHNKHRSREFWWSMFGAFARTTGEVGAAFVTRGKKPAKIRGFH